MVTPEPGKDGPVDEEEEEEVMVAGLPPSSFFLNRVRISAEPFGGPETEAHPIIK
jgi:hypothetical protein